jgi:D-alanyl-D-alanine carboxypeptidase
MKRATLVILALVLAGMPGMTDAAEEGFSIEVERLSPYLKDRMTGVSWHEDCPVPLRALRLMRISYHRFDGERSVGKLVVHRDAVETMKVAFRSMWRHDFRIRRMHLVDRYGGSDQRSMRADNTSAFNCRNVAGTDSWSQHAYGRAIDINPVENPYVRSDGSASPANGQRYTDRSLRRKGMIHAGDSTVRAFKRRGWGWGGYWSSPIDYQHFSATGH